MSSIKWSYGNTDLPAFKQAFTNMDKFFNSFYFSPTERLVPKALSNSNWRVHAYAEDVRYAFDRYEDKTFNYICEVHEHNSKLEANRDLAAREVRVLLEKFTTLNQALKAWPALSKLIAPEKLAKVHEKQQRKRKQDLQKEMADEVIVGSDINKTILAGALLGDDD